MLFFHAIFHAIFSCYFHAIFSCYFHWKSLFLRYFLVESKILLHQSVTIICPFSVMLKHKWVQTDLSSHLSGHSHHAVSLQLLAGLLPLPFCLWGTLLPLSLWPPNCRLPPYGPNLWVTSLPAGQRASASAAQRRPLRDLSTLSYSSTVDNETQWNRLITVKAAKEPKPVSRNRLRAKG